MKRLVYSLILTLFISVSFAQKPSWVNYEARTMKYPESGYLVGFSSEVIVKKDIPRDDILERLSGYAKDKLVQSVLTEIKSTTTMNINTTNGFTNEELKSASVASSDAQIAGLTVETYYENTKRDDVAYAFAYAEKKEVINHYENLIKTYLDRFNTDFGIAQDAQKNRDNQKALKILFGFQKDFRDVEHAQTLLVTMTGNYALPSVKRNEINVFKQKVENKIAEIRGIDQFTLEDAAYYIAFSMATQMEDKSQSILVNNFTFEDTPMGSKFSRRFKASIDQKLSAEGFSVVQDISTNPNALVLNGTYWENGDKLKIVTILRTQLEGKNISSAECYLPKRSIESLGIAYKPENYTQALVDQKIFAENEIVGGNLNIELWTNKGKDRLIYTEGEELRLFVRSNKEAYIRIIYYLADGSKVLLKDNFFINRDMVNKTVTIPDYFECAEPFGVETMQLNAQVDPFEPLNTYEEYGYEFITESTQSIQVKSRGFKKVKSTKVEDIKAERRLVFTTMPR